MAGGADAGIAREDIDPQVGEHRDHGSHDSHRQERHAACEQCDPARARNAIGADRHPDHRHRGDPDREGNRGQHELKPGADAVAGQNLGSELRQQVSKNADRQH